MRPYLLIAAMAVAAAASAQAEPTTVTVRALASDAKFIGTSMGGVRIRLRDARTGKLLAEGLTAGGTGDTATIIRQAHARDAQLANGETAKFETVLDLKQPTLVTAEAYGPVGKPDSAITVSSSLWLLPGRAVTGDGWILNFPGMVIEPTWNVQGQQVDLTARVTMMCGCHIEPGGDWDSARYRIEASLIDAKGQGTPVSMTFAGQPSVFKATLPKPAHGRYRLRIIAAQNQSPNAGAWEKPISIP